MKSALKFIFVLGTVLHASARQEPFFRRDYTYNETFDAFYKLHWESRGISWNSAFAVCDDEDATLFYPKFEDEWRFINHLAATITKNHNVTEIVLGLHDKFGLGEFVTVDGKAAASSLSVKKPDASHRYPSGDCVLMDIYTGSYRVGPCVKNDIQETMTFVCKKEKSVTCPTIDQGYEYVKPLNKCYKVNRRHKSWNDAMRTCYMEGGILTVIQNEEEARWIRDNINSNNQNINSDNQMLTYHVGIYKIFPEGEQYTVKGTVADSLYQRKYGDDDIEKDCGAIRLGNSALYTTTNLCHEEKPFICEIDLNARC